MNTEPKINWNGWSGPARMPGCGRTGMETRERAFWQSRDPEHRVVDLVDLRALAGEIRRTWP